MPPAAVAEPLSTAEPAASGVTEVDEAPRTLARAHRQVRRGGELFLRRRDIDDLQAALADARDSLHAERREDPSMRVAAEWLLDNDYLLRRVFHQLRTEVPAEFQRRLPWLASAEAPRVLVVAEALADPSQRDLDLEDLEAFLSAYQELTALTIAELWAMPALLRLVILRRLRGALERVLSAQVTLDAGGVCGRAVRALQTLAETDWKEVFSRLSVTDRLLREDPVGAYDRMDFDTRDAYRRAVEEVAFTSGRSEIEVTEWALACAREGPPDGRRDHVGHWLVGPGRRGVERALGARVSGLERVLLDNPHVSFLGMLAVAQAALLAPVVAYVLWLGAPPAVALFAVALVFVPSTIPATALVHRLVARLVRSRPLPKLDFSSGVPERWRTLVVMPVLLVDDEEIDRLIGQLEVHYLANPDPALGFALLTDHPDTDEPPAEQHAARLQRAKRGVRRLNARHGRDGRGPFHLLHRESRWNEAEGRWMGWERKRGKLQELNRYLRGDENTSYALHLGDPEALQGVAFVLTLDSDTQLPPGNAARLVGALAHPLNRPVADDDGRVRTGYTVIQPRVEISPRSARRSPFSRLFSGDTGIDIYSRAVSEVYQDLFGEGIYVGKGIYDLDAFRESVEDRVPEETLLSHDLFEGIHGRAALASDVVVYEDYPSDYLTYLHRAHRWHRGDWQLLPWLLPTVPTAAGRKARNRLGLLDLFKIVDNLRRSLVAPSLLALLLAGWTLLPGHPAFWTAAALLAPGAAAVASIAQMRSRYRRELGRWFLAVCFAPQEAWTVLDAIVRVLVRMLVTRRRLLEWTTAATAAHLFHRHTRLRYLRRLWVGPAAALGTAGGLLLWSPSTLPWASPWLLLWLLSPELGYRIGRTVRAVPDELPEPSVRMLRHVARRTWLFFETFVGPVDHWLPPDHFQERPRGAVAHRTSPTNIGMLLLSEMAAYDLGYLGPNGLASSLSSTLDGLEALERHRGHPYNWYDTRTLEPLEPRYVSTVDSGNLAGALLAVAVGCEQTAAAPPLPPQVRSGLRDAAELLEQAVERWVEQSGRPPARGALDAAHGLVALLAGDRPCDRALLEAAAAPVERIESQLVESLGRGGPVSRDPALLRELRLWLDRLDHQLSQARTDADLEEQPVQAAALADRLNQVAARARELAEAMDFGFLYDAERRLFCVGYNVTVDRRDPHHYDLLASEARLASFLAIVRRQVPVEHWFTLGRPLTQVHRHGRTLLSWGGSMFEYLMPRLLMRSHEGTLLQQSCAAAVDLQIDYGRQHGTPWGISESSYAFLDGQQVYQYRAFGVPGLGLRRGLEEDLVIAPYAAMLALPYRPRAVAEDLERLADLGMLGRFGFYDAADFHPRRAPGGRPALVRSYMAHHQGMGLVALANHLTGELMVQRFHADRRVQSGALLLDERVPGEVRPEKPLVEGTETADVALTPAPLLEGWEPDPGAPQVWTISNDSLTSLVTAEGGGGLRWHDLAVTRWEPDPVGDTSGTVVYVHDLESGETLAPTPVTAGSVDARVTFEAGVVEIHRRREGLSIRLRVAVASSADVELREVELSNEGDVPRRLRILGCLEPVLAPAREAASHPAFSKLFLRCAPQPELAGVVVSRIAREGRPPPVLFLRAIGDREASPRLAEIDRERFLGRRGSFRSPAALTAEGESAEHTLDPLCACAVDLSLAPGSSRVVTFVTAVAPTPSEVLDVGRLFGSPAAVRWAFEDATRAAARRVERLGVRPDLLRPAQRMLSALLCPDRARRAPGPTLAVGRPGQRRLWGRGISGDEPIVTLRLNSGESTELLEEVLGVHRYLRASGIRVDVVLLDETPSGYGEHASEAVRRVLADHGVAGLFHQRGGIHVVPVDQAAPAELEDLAAAAMVHLDARRGSLDGQLGERPGAAVELPRFEPAGPPPQSPPDPELPLEVPPLELDNGLGGFDGDEYVVRPGASPPAPWCNVIASETFGCLTSEAALGSSWALNAGENRLTPWHNDPVLDPPSEVLYLRDEETARVWTTTPLPAGEPTLVRHGQGYTTYESVASGVRQTSTVFVPPDVPAKIVRLRLHNASRRSRRLTATYYAEWVLGARRDDTRPYVLPSVSHPDACLLAETPWPLELPGRVAFLATDRAMHGCTTDRVEFLGRGGELARPAALRRWGLSGRVEPGLDPCAAVQVHLDLGPEQEIELSFFLGQAEDHERALETVRRLREPGAVDRTWQSCRAFWDRRLDAVRVHTPDPLLDRLCNRWLPYQSLSSRFFGRTAFYQSSGAFGFRDQLQDALAFVHLDASLTRRQLLASAAHQFVEGDVLHWWHPPGGAGVRTRCSDDLLWLVYATAEYLRATGDEGVLREQVPFLSGPALRAGEEVHYDRFEASVDATLLEHCRRALGRGFTAGPHGLPLIGDGDWNDGMNRVGKHGKGESVWLGWFLYACTERMAALLERVGEAEEAGAWLDRLPALARALSSAGWDGGWYRRAYHDDGTPIGSAHSNPPHIDSIAQSWAVLSGAGEPDEIRDALGAAERTLVDADHRLVLLLAPPFGPRGPDPGYIAAYPPGVRENGGQYTHAATWLGFAHAVRGDGDAAHRIFSLLNPLERTRTPDDVTRYRVEPYVIAADVYARPPWVGRGGWTWYTGSAAWMWRLAVEAILGLRRREGALAVDPCIPTGWGGFEAWVREGELTVHVVVHDAAGAGRGVARATLDGRPLEGARVPLEGGGERSLEVWLGAGPGSPGA